MAERFTKSMARNIYLGGSVFFVLLFLALTLDTQVRAMPERDNRELITEAVAKGKEVWEHNNCVGCHTIMGEGAYFAPELANVFDRRGGGDSATFRAYLGAWMKAMPTKVPGRRQMPQFNLTEKEVDALAAFLEWTSKIDDNNWPPNIEG
ncbi:c-type cytochrome [Marinobacter xestospongiae]|uniref:c-type cytochrome n=1 Tax=Marinobacter xestospongiae TaxID=994319 RepID=UPI0020067BA5|nr:cytochrome c [Marinobacter xestospongiae]MCK7565234.1 cytochrome c [Marinobacter xestospongiae]